MVGLGYSNPTPFDTPGEVSEEELETRLHAFDGLKPMIAICHAPPFSTSLDRITNLKHAGSYAVREFLRREQPRYFFCGHIHEAAGAQDKLGETSAMNVGKKGYVLDLDQQAEWGSDMATLGLVEYADASAEVRAVYDDIMATRKTDWINNFWKALAHDPVDAAADVGKHQGNHEAGRARSADEGNDLCRGERDESVRVLHCVAHGGRAEGGDDGCDVRGADGGDRDGERDEPAGERVSGGDR